jgi:DMSO reductase family type II enzyme heme b subunit
MTRNQLSLVITLAVVVAGAAVLLPAVTDAQTQSGVPVEYVEDSSGFETPTGSGWTAAQTAMFPLSGTGADVPMANDVSIEEVQVEAVRTNERIYLRTSWADPTRDASDGSVRSFADQVAVQLPAAGENQPPIAMGSNETPVNIWSWSSSDGTEEIMAAGPGSSTPFAEQTLRTKHTYADGRWHVVFIRPLDPSGSIASSLNTETPPRTTIPTDTANLDVAFGVWNGSNMEVSGRKSASQWHRLAVGSGPPGYERFLWVIAGVAIVLTTLVTIEGIRRKGGE